MKCLLIVAACVSVPLAVVASPPSRLEDQRKELNPVQRMMAPIYARYERENQRRQEYFEWLAARPAIQQVPIYPGPDYSTLLLEAELRSAFPARIIIEDRRIPYWRYGY